MKQTKLICVIIIGILLFVSFSSLTTSTTVNYWGQSTIQSAVIGSKNHFITPDVTMMANGKLLVCFDATVNSHTGAGPTYLKIGTINSTTLAVTWGDPFLPPAFPNDGTRTSGFLHVTPNGSVICFIAYNVLAYLDPEQLYCYISYDNATTWTYQGVLLTPGGEGIMLGLWCKNYNGVIYGLGRKYCPVVNLNKKAVYFWKNDNNGSFSDWELVSTVGDTVNATINDTYIDETDFVFINDTHIVAIARCSPNYLGSIHHFWRYESFDAGLTWTNLTDIYSQVGWYQMPTLSWLNEDEHVMILSGGHLYPGVDNGCYSAYYISSDEGNTWTNLTNFSYYGVDPTNDNGYGAFANYNDTTGYLVWFYGAAVGACSVYGNWVADNTTYESTGEFQFISIDGGTNGTTLYNSTPTFNWTLENGAIQYQLQVATTSSFGEPDLVVNISNINELNYPTEYDENATRVSFRLPTINALPSYNRYYCRVRAYE